MTRGLDPDKEHLKTGRRIDEGNNSLTCCFLAPMEILSPSKQYSTFLFSLTIILFFSSMIWVYDNSHFFLAEAFIRFIAYDKFSQDLDSENNSNNETQFEPFSCFIL